MVEAPPLYCYLRIGPSWCWPREGRGEGEEKGEGEEREVQGHQLLHLPGKMTDGPINQFLTLPT